MMAASNSPSDPGGALDRLTQALGAARREKRLPPVESWNPAHCGAIDMRIASDGTWFYNGTPIGRRELVKLFSTVLRRDPDGYVLVTPVEKLTIAVDDAPFAAVEMALEGEGEAREIAFRTNVDDVVRVGPDHPLRFERDEGDGVKPYLHVRAGLWARVTRALTYDLLELGEEREVEGRAMFGIVAGGAFHPVAPAHEARA